MKECHNCGKELPNDLLVCPFCGARQNDTTHTLPELTRPVDEKSLEAAYTQHIDKLLPHQVALYVEDESDPLIVDVNDNATIGRRTRGTGVVPTVALNTFDAFNKGVSRIHVTLHATADQIMLIDEYATNGTWLNDKKLEPMTPTPLSDGDQIKLGKLRIRLFLAKKTSS